jgi:polyhydroxybutyrate depolymerase
VRYLFGRVSSRTLLYTLLALACVFAVVTGIGLAWPGTLSPFALSAAPVRPTSHPQQIATAIATMPIPSAGCGAVSPIQPGTSAAETLRVGALDRRYRLHVPVGYQPGIATPLVLNFHAHTSNAQLAERSTRFSQLADLHHFIVVYPQGVVGPDGSTGWNTGRGKDPSVDDLGFVDALLTHVQGMLCVDPRRIYATGFSNGGGFVAVLACDRADRIAAFAPVAGDYYPQPGGCHPTQTVSVLEIHGTADTINPYGGSTQLRYPSVGTWLTSWATRDGCDSSPSTTTAQAGVTALEWSDCRSGARVLHYRLIGVGHVWPMGPASESALSTPTASASDPSGTTRPEPFDATTAIWSFFSQTELNADGTSGTAA